MTIKERIHAAIDDIQDDRLDELYGLVRNFMREPAAPPGENIMDKLKRVRLRALPTLRRTSTSM